MRKHIKLIGLIMSLGLLSVAGCKDVMEDYYGDKDAPGLSSTEILEQLKSDTAFSKFVALLEETGVDKEFDKDVLYTVWAPSNGTLPDTVDRMSPEAKKTLVLNHMCYVVLYQRNLERVGRVKTLSGKYLTVVKNTGGLSVDGVELEKGDQVCRNGVVHGLKGWLMPRKNIYEWLESLSDDYSMFRDSLLVKNVRVFDKANSVPTGVNEMGQTVYDTVWKIQNAVLARGDIRAEDKVFTFFVPDNQAFMKMYEETTMYLHGVKSPCTRVDTALWVDWVLKASIHEDVFTPVEGKKYNSVYEKDFRLGQDWQVIAAEPSVLSNGQAYVMSHCHIPRNLYLKPVEFNPYFNRVYAPDQYDWNPGFLQMINLDEGRKIAQVQFGKNAPSCAFSFLSCNYDDMNGFYKVQVMPGKYQFTGRIDAMSKADSIRVSINDGEITTLRGIVTQQAYTGKQGIIAEEIMVGDTLGPITLKLETLKPVGITMTIDYTCMAPGRFVLTPTDNY